MINLLRALMDKVDSTQEQMGNVSRDGNPKNQKEKNARDLKTTTLKQKGRMPPAFFLAMPSSLQDLNSPTRD